MIFLLPVPLLLASVAGFYAGKLVFLECEQQGRQTFAGAKRVQPSTEGLLVASLIFAGAYVSTTHPLRHWLRSPPTRAAAAKQVKTLADFWREFGPGMLVHLQGLSAATVCAGLGKGATDAWVSRDSQQE